MLVLAFFSLLLHVCVCAVFFVIHVVFFVNHARPALPLFGAGSFEKTKCALRSTFSKAKCIRFALWLVTSPCSCACFFSYFSCIFACALFFFESLARPSTPCSKRLVLSLVRRLVRRFVRRLVLSLVLRLVRRLVRRLLWRLVWRLVRGALFEAPCSRRLVRGALFEAPCAVSSCRLIAVLTCKSFVILWYWGEPKP